MHLHFVTAAAVLATTSAAHAALTVADFDDIPQGPQTGLFTTNGVNFNVLGGTVNIEPPVSPFADSTIPNVATPNNSQLAPILGSLAEPTQTVTFDYFDQGGTVALGVNGSAITGSDFVSLVGANTWPDAVVSVAGTATTGEVTVVFQNSNLQLATINVFGQETQFDNFTFDSIPEPASLGLLALGALGMVRRR